jgi:hypothetical protein
VNTLAVADTGVDRCASPAYKALGARFVVSGGSACCGAVAGGGNGSLLLRDGGRSRGPRG